MTIKDNEFTTIQTPTGPMRAHVFRPADDARYPGVILYSEIFQVTGPIRRTASQLASEGYIVLVPEIYHEFEPEGTVLAYDPAGTERGNVLKTTKDLSAFDSDARAAVDYLAADPGCTGAVGVMGICIGGHLAFRAAFHPEIRAAVCFYATDIHKGSLGKGMKDDSLQRAGEIRGELLHIWGRQDPHIPFEGRTAVRQRLEEAGVNYSWLEVNAAHAFLRDEGPRYNPALARQCLGFAFDLFHRRLR